MNWEDASALATAAVASSAAVCLVQVCKRVVLTEEQSTERLYNPERFDWRSHSDMIFRLLSGASACILFSWVYYILQAY